MNHLLGPTHRLRHYWLHFHVWTLVLVAGLTIANVVYAVRPFETASPKQQRPGLIRLATNDAGSKPADRKPATQSDAAQEALAQLNLTEANIGCQSTMSLRLPAAVQQVRLHVQACKDLPTIISIRNETNGFEATLFPDRSTDYISLAKTGNSSIIINRGAHAQTLTIVK